MPGLIYLKACHPMHQKLRVVEFQIKIVHMALSELEIKKCEKLVGKYVERHRPPPHMRNELDLAYRIENQSVDIFEIRPWWKNPEKKIEEPVAKAIYVKSRGTWKIYWQRADLKWHLYEPQPEVTSLEAFLDEIEKDEYACFYG